MYVPIVYLYLANSYDGHVVLETQGVLCKLCDFEDYVT